MTVLLDLPLLRLQLLVRVVERAKAVPNFPPVAVTGPPVVLSPLLPISRAPLVLPVLALETLQQPSKGFL